MQPEEYRIGGIGLGSVGLSVAVELWKRYRTIGYDRDVKRIEELRNGVDRTLEVSNKFHVKIVSNHGINGIIKYLQLIMLRRNVMSFAIIYTVLLVLSVFPLFLTATGRMIPIGVRIFPFIAIIILWIYTLFFKIRGRSGFLGPLLLILFYFCAYIMVFLPAVGSIIIGRMDRPRNLPPVIAGDLKSQNHIAMVYHPGASDFTADVLTRLSKTLGEEGYKITLYTARSDLSLDTTEVAAVGVASPVYGGRIRPPLENFINNADLRGINCFVILTGGDGNSSDRETLKAASLIEKRGGIVVDRAKFITQKDRKKVYSEVDRFGKNLLHKL